MTEREAIVAWLRELADKNSGQGPIGDRAAFEQRIIADAIERGQHLENKDG